VFGTLCALDPLPTDLKEEDFEIFELFAQLIAYELEAEEKQAERERQLVEERKRNEMQQRFMSILSHDLRSPLNTISGAANVQLLVNRDNEKSSELAEKILRSARQMNMMIYDLLDAARSQNGTAFPVEKKTLNLCEVAGNLVEDFRLAHPDRKLNFFAGSDFFGDVDETRFCQVLTNLLSNAVRYGAPDQPITVTLRENESEISLAVNNQGEPISDEDCQNLFNPFWRGTQTKENSKGLGLGLYIVEQIMRAHNGRIAVGSNKETGTTFTAFFGKQTKKY
jgi:phosphoserine phosphatase RsbU/P